MCNEQDWYQANRFFEQSWEKSVILMDLSMAYHHHMGTCIQNEERNLQTCYQTQILNLYNLCADTGHLYFAGMSIQSNFLKKI